LNKSSLIAQIKQKKTFLCVGLDVDPNLIPEHLKNQKNGVLAFNKAIIDATKDLCVSYKINTAFFEAQGARGWDLMEEIFAYIPDNCLKIADAKRGDIGNTSSQYATAFFDNLKADAITLSPYMGFDSIDPFLDVKNKWSIVLALTSNKGSNDFEKLELTTGEKLYERVVKDLYSRYGTENLMFVVGATNDKDIATIRKLAPYSFFLVPGIGAQGGNLKSVCENGLNSEIGLLVNASRSIIYASSGADFATAAHDAAKSIQNEMSFYI
jgi:orotidine-5'-phosphate decarboxylase